MEDSFTVRGPWMRVCCAEIHHARQWIPGIGPRLDTVVTAFGPRYTSLFLAARLLEARAINDNLYELKLKDPSGTLRAVGGYFTQKKFSDVLPLVGTPLMVEASASTRRNRKGILEGRLSVQHIIASTTEWHLRDCASAVGQAWQRYREAPQDAITMAAAKALRAGQDWIEDDWEAAH